ncbi:MAG: hypothetical protein IKQ60_01795 [Candidatus Methanomethylophilaceae archaeon]|nr:hypothetical protein [Candidatus Methanomethylophilaceae archaeon]
MCEDFIGRSTELATAKRIIASASKKGDGSRYRAFVDVCSDQRLDAMLFRTG